jgi:hypothetical protein
LGGGGGGEARVRLGCVWGSGVEENSASIQRGAAFGGVQLSRVQL